MDYITKLSKETDPSIYKYRLLNLINNWGRITLFTGKSMKDTYITFETAILAKKIGPVSTMLHIKENFLLP